MAPRNLVNLKDVGKGYAGRTVLEGLTLGVADGERIGVVGRNGDGKSTLLRLIAGEEQPDAGALTRERGLRTVTVAQRDALADDATVEAVVARGRPEHEWRGEPLLAALLGGVWLGARVGSLSGGERRRVALAEALLDDPELLLLDEPTNHLDVEAVDWLARHLAARRGALVVVTHDRWFLDAVVQQTWEVADREVHQYEGGYAAYVLAKAERERQAASSEARRQQLLRKELAWLRRGPPARTSKPKFRIEAANALIADVPEVRDRVELLRFSGARLGDRVLDAEAISVAYGERRLLHDLTWRLGPGDRVAVVGANGTGKSTLLRALAGETALDAGRVDRGATVRLAFLTQEAAELPEAMRVIEAVEAIARRTTLADGRDLTAGGLLERLGFVGPKQRTLVRDLSGGERRRLQLTRLLMGEPNVLLLDEPTNDLDTEVLAALEDLLDAWAGTLVAVSHDRFFVERVCDDVFALDGRGGLRHLPGGIEQYLADRREAEPPPPSAKRSAGAGGQRRAAQKEVARLERAIEKAGEREAELQDAMAVSATDHGRLRRLTDELAALRQERDALEAAWLEAAELLEA